MAFENLKLDKAHSDKTIVNYKNFEKIQKEHLRKEKEEMLAKINEFERMKVDFENLKLVKSEGNNNNSNNESKEFICKFCKNRQDLKEPEFPIVDPSKKNKINFFY